MTKTGRSVLALDERLANTLRHALEATLTETFQVSIQLEPWSVGKVPLKLEPYVACMINMREENYTCGMLILAFSRETLIKILGRYGVYDVRDPKIIDDAAEELANIIYGMVKTALNKMGHHLVMALPCAIHEKKGAAYDGNEKMVLPFLADGRRCRAVVAQAS